jgi:hypothetical protein
MNDQSAKKGLVFADYAEEKSAIIAVWFGEEVIGESGEVVSEADVNKAMYVVGGFE